MLSVLSGAVTVPSYSLLLTVNPKTVMPVTSKGLEVIFAVVDD